MLYKYDSKEDSEDKDILKLNGDSYLITYMELEIPAVSNRDLLLFYRFPK